MPAAVVGLGCLAFERRLAFWVMAGLAVAWHSEDARREALRNVDLAGGRLEGFFEVREVSGRGRQDRRTARWVEVGSEFAGGKVKIIFEVPGGEEGPRVGDEWACAGWLARKDIDDRRPRKLWVKGRSSYARPVKRAGSWNLSRMLDGVKRGISRRMDIGLEGKRSVADLHRAMLLGTRNALPDKLRQMFADAGTIHVFAISGLHVMVVAKVLVMMLVLLAIPWRWMPLLLIPGLWLYVEMIGAPASAIRAAAMASVYFSAAVFRRRPNSLAAWEVTMLAFALVDPQGFWSVGSMLSFLVMLAILLVVRVSRRMSRARWLLVPLAAWAAGLPIAARIFARVAPVAILANLLTVPLAALSVLLSALGVLASFVSTWAAVHINNFAALFTEAMVGVSWVTAAAPGGVWQVSPWPLWLCAIWYAALALAIIFLKLRVESRRRI